MESINKFYNKRRAFTLVELLVVIAIIALLLSILMPALNRVREAGRRVKCGGYLHNSGLALMLYAQENNGYFPVRTPSIDGDGLCGMGIPNLNVLAKFGINRQNLYCPSNKEETMVMKNQDVLWNNFGTRRVTGYFWMLPTVSIMESLPTPLPLNSGKVWAVSTMQKNAVEIELMSDNVLSDRNSPWTAANGYPYGNFDYVRAGGAIIAKYTTSHMIGSKADKAAGGNILFCDGHVSWRPFMKGSVPFMQPRNDIGSTFWW